MDIKELFLSLSNDEKQDFLDFATDWLEKWTGPMKDPDGDDDYVAPAYDERLGQAARIMTNEKRDDMFNTVTRDAIEDNAYDVGDVDTITKHYIDMIKTPERSVTNSNELDNSLNVELDDEEKEALLDIISGLSPKYEA